MSIRLRLTLTYALVVAAILLAFSLVLYATMRSTLQTEMDRRLEVRASQVQLTIWPDTDTLTPDYLIGAKLDLSPLADLDAPNLYVQVLAGDGRILATSETLRGATLPVDFENLAHAMQGQRGFADFELAPERAVRILTVPISYERSVLGALQVGQSREPLRETMDGLRTLLQLLGLAALVVSGVVGWVVAQRGLRPLALMSNQASDIAVHRDFGRRLGLNRRDEVGTLANTIDGLLATVDETLRTHRDFVADTSHELRNPLLALRTNLELLNRVTDSETRAECLADAQEQVERMARLVTDLLLLARIEAGQVIQAQPVALRQILRRVARAARLHANGQVIRLDAGDDVVVAGDDIRIAQILTNLVDNALRFTSPGGTVAIALRREGNFARLSVQDDGSGIQGEHLPHVFERFYHGDGAGARDGLGLAIVKHLAEAHGGRVQAASEFGRGSIFTIWLPADLPLSAAPLDVPSRAEVAAKVGPHTPQPLRRT